MPILTTPFERKPEKTVYLIFTVIAHGSDITYGGRQSIKWWTLLLLIKTTMNDSNYNFNICPGNYIVCWTEMKLEYMTFWSTFSFQWQSFLLDTCLVCIFLYTRYCRDSIYKSFSNLLFLFKSLFYPLEILRLKKTKIIFLVTDGLDSLKDTCIIFPRINRITQIKYMSSNFTHLQ